MHLARSLQADPPRIPAASTRDTGKPGPSRRMRDRARGAAGRFARNEDGAIVFFAVFVFLMMLIVAGIGIDVMRYERDRANMQYTLDRAVLAASSLGQRQDPETVVRDYLSLAGLIDNLRSVHVNETATSRTVQVESVGRMATQFMHMAGIDGLDYGAVSVAHEAIPNSEISLVLDISGSMAHNQREETMKEAANSFISGVLSRNVVSTQPLTSVNVIPFAGQTNPGPEMFDFLGGDRFGTTGEDYFPEWQQDISNIVFWYDTNFDGIIEDNVDTKVKIDDYPDNDVELFNKDDLDSYLPYVLDFIARQVPSLPEADARMLGATIKGGLEPTSFYSVSGNEVGGSTNFKQPDYTFTFDEFYNSIVPNNTSSCIEMTYSDFESTTLPDGSTDQVGHFAKFTYDGTSQDWGWCPEDDTAIQYAQKEEATLHSFVDSLRLHDGTGTNYAMKYALALLDPSTQAAFEHLAGLGVIPGEFANRPLPWDETNTDKYIVLLTDGEITGQDRPTDELDPLNSIEELTDRPTDDTVSTSSRSTNLILFHQQCELAKQNGVIIYTVAFEAPSTVIDDLQTCASSPAHFFDVDGPELVSTFVAIATSIQRLRLIQ